jgi:hypothetical protein
VRKKKEKRKEKENWIVTRFNINHVSFYIKIPCQCTNEFRKSSGLVRQSDI